MLLPTREQFHLNFIDIYLQGGQSIFQDESHQLIVVSSITGSDSCGASTRSCSLSYLLSFLRVLTFPSLIAVKYSSWSPSGSRKRNGLKMYFSAWARSMSSRPLSSSSSLASPRSGRG